MALVLCAPPVTLAAQTPVTIDAAAGFGSLVKGSRWTPVRVELQNSSAEVAATLRVTWADASVEQPVTIAAGARRVVNLLLRTAEPESTIRVALEGRGGSLTLTREFPVTIMPFDAPLMLCVAGVDSETPEESCSATVSPARLPPSPRGYDSVDQLVVADGARVARDTRLAIQQWQSLRSLDLAGDLALTPQPTRPVVPAGFAARLSTVVLGVFGAYALALLIVAAVAARLSAKSWSAWMGAVSIFVLGGVASVAIGRVGPGSEIVVHHSSLLQQIPGSSASALLLRGLAEFPTEGEQVLTVPVGDGMLEMTTARDRAPQAQDETGQPVLRSAHGLGARQSFAVESVVEQQWVRLTIRDNMFEVRNVASHALEQCRFADGVTPTDVGILTPGSVVTAVRQRDNGGPLFTCVTATPVLTLRASSHAVLMRGSTRLAVYAPRDVAVDREGAPND